MTALPMEVPVSYQEIAHCLEKINFENRKPSAECAGTNSSRAICRYRGKRYISGRWWCFAARGLDKRLTDKLNIQFHIADDPLHAAVPRTGIALKNVDKFGFLIR